MMENCSRFNYFSANLCPLDRRRYERVWYPDEDYCHRTDIRPDWVNIQMRVKRIVKDKEKFFTVTMLEAIDKVYKGLKGIDPESKETPDQWIKKWKDKRKKAKLRYLESDLYKKHQKRLLEAV